ncbi:MAG: DNA polymerase-3 subunit beta [Chloroflexi bacterium]|jgi:DNA polymerase-3 subunit beta|nr:MAG: DNA polymerase-3 subunit beta [Chloroflexota bacterium]
MRIICLKDNLSKGLSIVSRAVATRTTLPITQNVVLTTDQGRLKLSSTNLEIAISTWIGAEIQDEGSITIPARILTEFVNSLPSEAIEIEQIDSPLGLSLKCKRSQTSINGNPTEDFPPIPTVDSGVVANISVGELKKAIAHVVFAAATEDSRPVLTGVKCDITGETFTLAAADGFRLAVYTGNLSAPIEESLQFIIPGKALTEISRLAGSQKDDVMFTVTPSKSQALIKLENIELVSQLIQGSFPDYNQLLPEKYDNKVVVTQEHFLAATKTAAIFARDGSGIIRLQSTGSGEDSRLMISSRAEEIGESEGEVDATVESGSNDMKIAFNARYLSDVLEVLGQGNVVLETTSPSSPGVIKAEGTDNYIHVVMPMFVQW